MKVKVNALPKVKFQQWTCELVFMRYEENDRTAIQLISDDPEPESIAMATVNVPCFPLTGNEVLIKNYSENEGMLEALTGVGVVKPTGAICTVGHVAVHVCMLLVDPPTVH